MYIKIAMIDNKNKSIIRNFCIIFSEFLYNVISKFSEFLFSAYLYISK